MTSPTPARARRPRRTAEPPPAPPPAAPAGEEDLEALFDRIAAERAQAQAPAPPAAVAPVAEPCDVFRRIGTLTRTLHEALRELGYDRAVEAAVGALPDTRARLAYVGRLTGEAAEKVLGAVERGQAQQAEVAARSKELSAGWERLMRREMGVDEFRALALATREFLGGLPGRAAASGDILSEIMVAQDFHDLTGQVIQRVVGVAQNLEDQLVKLLIDATPPPLAGAAAGALAGPAVDAAGRDDVVTSQAQVDDLLASLGF